MGKIDKTKKNIKIESISDKTKKELFNKFIEAGGQIIHEDIEISKKTNKPGIFDRKKQAAYRKLFDSYKEKNIKDKSSTKASGTVKSLHSEITKSYSAEYKPNLLISFSQRVIIRLRLFFMGITDFSADTFNNKFFHIFITEYKTALMGIKMLYLELFKQNKNVEYTLIYELDKINPDNTKLIENTSQIYDETEIINITSEYSSAPESIQPIIKYKNEIISIFKKLYILKPYEHIILTAFNTSIEIHMKIASKKSSFYYTKRKNIKDDLYVIFEKLFYSLYWLICRYHNRIIPLGSFEFEKILNINQADKLVNKKKKTILSQDNLEDTEKEIQIQEETDNTEQKKDLNDEIKAGLMLMENFNPRNIKKLRTEYDNAKSYSILKDNDKMLLIFIILQEFDNEYSFLLTTSKIKYKFDHKDSRFINFKEKLQDYYDDIKKCMDSIKEYSETYEMLIKVMDEKPISNDRYIAYTKNLNAVIKRRELAANTARFYILKLMNNISSAFRFLIEDINGEKKYIDDPQETIEFEISIDGNKKLNNKTILEALSMTYNFAAAFAYRLTTDGDLSGFLEFDAADADNDQKKLIPDETKDSASLKETASTGENEKEKSIIDEIDEMFSE